QQQVARLQREAARAEREQLRDAEEHLRGRRVLHHLAVHPSAKRERLRVGDLLRSHDDGTYRAKRVEALAARPLTLRELNVPRGDVVADRVAEHVVERRVGGNGTHAPPDDDPELDLPVDLARELGVDDDRLTRADDAGGKLREDERLRWSRQVRLADVVEVVEPDRDDLPGLERCRQLIRSRIADAEMVWVDACAHEREEIALEVEAPKVAVHIDRELRPVRLLDGRNPHGAILSRGVQSAA